MDELKTLDSLGFEFPSPAYIIGVLLFSLIGFAAYRYGKKASLSRPKWIGVVLMFYPYAIGETWLLFVVGAALCIALYVFRE